MLLKDSVFRQHAVFPVRMARVKNQYLLCETHEYAVAKIENF